MQKANAQSLVDSTERLKEHFEPLLAALDLALPPSKPSSIQEGLASLADILRHQQLLLEVAESSGKLLPGRWLSPNLKLRLQLRPF